MAPTVCLSGVSLCSTIPSYSTDNQPPVEVRQCHSSADKLSSSGFLGQSLPTVSSSRWCLSPASAHRFLKLRRNHGATAFLLPISVQLVASLSTGPAGGVLKGQKPGKKRWRTRRKIRSEPSSDKSGLAAEGVAFQGKKPFLVADALSAADSLASKLSTSAQIIGENGNESEKSERKEVPADLFHRCWQSGDPLGKRVLGKAVVKWISRGMEQLAGEVAQAQQRGEAEEISEKMSQSGLAFVAFAQPYLAEIPMPLHSEALCLKASTHYPTLFDHFQRQLQEALQKAQSLGNWQESQAWKLLKRHARSGESLQTS